MTKTRGKPNRKVAVIHSVFGIDHSLVSEGRQSLNNKLAKAAEKQKEIQQRKKMLDDYAAAGDKSETELAKQYLELKEKL